MSKKEGQIIIGRDIPQFDPCGTVLGIYRCMSMSAECLVWIVEVVNCITQWLYFVTIKVCKWLVLKQGVDELRSVILIRS